jgi:DNA-binding CsgD family transcriptional regulator/tetratricopeptide (TPR) repeat protein
MSRNATARRFVARAAELALLRAALERAGHASPSTVLVAGDAGVGKSRLVAEVAAQARAEGATVLVGHCVDLGEGELPFAPIAGALRSLFAQLDADELDSVLGGARGEVAQLVPDLGWAGEPPGHAGAFATARLFELVLGVLGRAAARAPVLLVVEDLHWADSSTRDLLRFLVRSAGGERIALIVTYRSDELHRAHPLRPYVAELARDPRVERIELAPFTREEFVDHVAVVCGSLPNAAVLDRLFERSEGNAFYTEELLAAVEGGGPDVFPASLREAMLLRLERLSPRTQQVLRILAAAGWRVDYDLLAATSELADRGLDEALREAVAAGVLVTTANGACEFRHALLREAAYTELLPGERERLHARLAEALEARARGDATGAAQHAELAHHWQAAGALDRALPASVRAGDEAARVYAYPEALRHYRRALELWERVPPAARAGVDVVRTASSAAAAARAAGEHELEVALSRRAVEVVDAEAEPLRAAVLRSRLARSLLDTGRVEEGRAASAQAVAMLPTEPTEERARVLAAHARLLLYSARIEEGRAPVEEAIAIARTLGLRAVEADALASRVIVVHGRPEEAVATGRAAVDAARAAGDPEILAHALNNAAITLELSGRLEEANELASEGVDIARRAGEERLLMHLKGDAAYRLLKLGRLDEAQAMVAEVQRSSPSGVEAAELHGTAAVIAARRGDADGAASAVRLVRSYMVDAGGGLWSARAAVAQAELELWRGDAERAQAIVDEALAQVGDAEFIWYSAALYALGAWAHADLALRARALRRDAEVDLARAAIAALRERLDARLVEFALSETAAYRAQLTAELGRLDDPPDAGAWAAAHHGWDRLGFRYQAALCRWREAEARLAGDGDRARVAELLGDAHRDAQALDARPLLAQVEALARRARIELAGATPTEPSAAAQTGLSPRELEVLALVADGLTNREIGSALFISEKTVRVHVSRILAKLGAANRTQAATLAQHLGIRAAGGVA